MFGISFCFFHESALKAIENSECLISEAGDTEIGFCFFLSTLLNNLGETLRVSDLNPNESLDEFIPPWSLWVGFLECPKSLLFSTYVALSFPGDTLLAARTC